MIYTPRRQPPATSPAHRAAVRAWFGWKGTNDRLTSQGVDLLLAGRVEEFAEFERDVIRPHRDSEPRIP